MLDPLTRREIEKATSTVLRDAGLTTPPVRIEDLLEHLRVHRDFYDLEDPSFLQRAVFRTKVEARQLMDLIRQRVRLAAVWLPDEARILVDTSLHHRKQQWASFHDATHGLLPWHRPYYMGETAQTLDPGFQEILEAEANFGASALVFCGPRFTQEALDLPVEWKSVQTLQKRYNASLQSTGRRLVEHGPDRAMALVVSTPWWKDVPPDQPHRCRHLIASPRLLLEFPGLTADLVMDSITDNTRWRKGGPVGDFTLGLLDGRGTMHEFAGTSFYNQKDILTLLVHEGPWTARHFAGPADF